MRKAQSVLEYAVVVVVFISALLAMQIYLKRSVQGRLRETADSIGQQYSPGNTSSVMYMSSDSNSQSTSTTEEIDVPIDPGDPSKGKTTKLLTTSNWSIIGAGDTFNRWGTESVGPFEASLFGGLSPSPSGPPGFPLTWEQMYQVWRTAPSHVGGTSRSAYLKSLGVTSGEIWDAPSATPGLTIEEAFEDWCDGTPKCKYNSTWRTKYRKSLGVEGNDLWNLPYGG